MIFRAVLTDKGNDQTLFSRFLARATLVSEVFLEIRCRRFAASFLFVAKKNFIKNLWNLARTLAPFSEKI